MDSEQSFGRYVSMLHRFRRSFMARRLGDLGCAAGLYVFLLALGHRDGQNQEQISARLRIDKAATCKALQKLEREGYVRRDVDERDRRAYRVYLSEAGSAVLPAIHQALREWDQMVTGMLPKEEVQALAHMLKQLAERAAEAISDPTQSKP